MESRPIYIHTDRFLVAKKLLKMLQASFTIDPILGNLVAIILGIGILVLLEHPTLFPKLGKYYYFFTNIIYGLILLQIIRSATKSLSIPLIVISISGLGMGLCNLNPDWHWISLDIFKTLMLLGSIGVGASIFAIK